MIENIGVSWFLSIAAVLGAIAIAAFFGVMQLVRSLARAELLLTGQSRASRVLP
jgi:hypothetical protein